MINYQDLKDKKIGYLTVLNLTDDMYDYNGTTKLWKCKCECGNIVYRSSSKLNEYIKKNRMISCGCKTYKTHINEKFGDLTVKRKVKINNILYYECVCICGKIVYKKTNRIKTCNYICREKNKDVIETRKKLRCIYQSIKSRCYFITNKSYKDYGGRGIKVCDEWLGEKGFENFYKWSLQNGYQENLSIDRIDNNCNYEPNNCRWATRNEQANNKRTNIFITYNGETKTLKQWCDKLNLPYRKSHNRLKDLHWSIEKIFNS